MQFFVNLTKEFGAIPRPVCSHDDIQSLRDKKKATAFSLHCGNLTEGNLSTAGVEERAVNFKYCNSNKSSSASLPTSGFLEKLLVAINYLRDMVGISPRLLYCICYH